MADDINQHPNQNKEEKSEELIKSLLASMSGKKTTKANVGATAAMEVNDDHEAIVKVAIVQLQSILGGSNKRCRRDGKGGKD